MEKGLLTLLLMSKKAFNKQILYYFDMQTLNRLDLVVSLKLNTFKFILIEGASTERALDVLYYSAD